MIRTLTALAGTLTLTIALAACGGGEPDAQATTPATSAAVIRNEVECVNIMRAYTAWSSTAPRSAADVTAVDEVTMMRWIDDAEELADSVRGYSDQASKALSVAAAEARAEISFVNVQLTFGGEVDAARADKVMTAIEKVHTAHTDFRAATCS